jgi:glucose/arabinose dehydrogenase
MRVVIPAVLRRLPALVLPLLLAGCWSLLPSSGGGQTSSPDRRSPNPADVALPDGYRAEVVATGLTFPTAVTFDGDGGVYVLEAGYSYGEVWTTPRLLRIDPGGSPTVIATGENPPWNGVVFHGGSFYVAEGGEKSGGRILRVAQDGKITPIVEDLPSVGDHHTDGPAVGSDGWIYFGQGTATNSAVVGTDNADFGWLARHPDFHDVPCKDVRLAGKNFTSDNPLTPESGDKASTGAYSAFGQASTPGQVVPGKVPCGGAVMRVRPEGGKPELVAWGFRNPFGLAFSPDGRLYVTENGYDQRGSRPVFGSPDVLWAVEPGAWYGWPDYAMGVKLKDGQFSQGPNPPLDSVLAQNPGTPPGTPPKPAATFGVHASANGFDFSRSESFGHMGEAFVAEFGDMAPKVGKVLGPVGFKVVRVDPKTGKVEDFAVNRKDKGPASRIGGGGLERPVAARFDPSGNALYVVDFGIMTVGPQGPQPRPETGVLWKITRTGGTERRSR